MDKDLSSKYKFENKLIILISVVLVLTVIFLPIRFSGSTGVISLNEAVEHLIGMSLLTLASFACVQHLKLTKSTFYLYLLLGFIALFIQNVIHLLTAVNYFSDSFENWELFTFESWVVSNIFFVVLASHNLFVNSKILYKLSAYKLVASLAGPLATSILAINILFLIYQKVVQSIFESGSIVTLIIEAFVSVSYAVLIIFYLKDSNKSAPRLLLLISLLFGLMSNVGYFMNYEHYYLNEWYKAFQLLSYFIFGISIFFKDSIIFKGELYKLTIVKQIWLIVLTFLMILTVYAAFILSFSRLYLELGPPTIEGFVSGSGLIVLLMIFSLILSIGYSLITIRNIVFPINILTKELSKFAEGNLNSKVSIISNDEIGHLGSIFNDMSTRLSGSYTNLEEKSVKLSQKINEAEDTKKAILNVLEDLRFERQELEETNAKDEAILRSIGEGVVVTDVGGRILIMNKIAGEMFEININKALGKVWATDLPTITNEKGERCKFENSPIGQAVLTGKVISSSEYIFYTQKTNQKLEIAVTSAPVVMEGKIIGAVSIYRDISVEKQIDRAKTEFVSLASHQLRTPLSAINWFSEMLLTGDAGRINNKQKSYLQEIYSGNKRMVDLVNALLNVSRIDLGTLAVEPKMIDIRKITLSVLKEQAVLIRSKKLKIEKDIQSKLPLLNADPNLIRIVIQNIINNAVKYTPEKGTVKITIKSDDINIFISIADTGYGIPKKDQSKIFTKLFRADNVREQDTDGNGLGLYITKSVVEHAANGKIWFKSVENKGTTFYIKLPIKGMKKKEGTKGLV